MRLTAPKAPHSLQKGSHAMARQNDFHTPETLEKLVNDFSETLDLVRDGIKRVKKNQIDEPISLAHGSALQKGMTAIKNFARELHAKIDKKVDIYSVKGVKMR